MKSAACFRAFSRLLLVCAAPVSHAPTTSSSRTNYLSITFDATECDNATTQSGLCRRSPDGSNGLLQIEAP
jgi:hypothetical protein